MPYLYFMNKMALCMSLLLLILFESNGVVERRNRTLMDMINAMLLSFGVPKNLWEEAMLLACFILNRIPLKDCNTTPYELWKGRAP